MARVLIAEDDPDLRGMIEFKLLAAGHVVVAVADGKDALVQARVNPPDVVVLDVMMPGLTGLEVCEALRREPATAATPIIMVTALAQTSDVDRGLASGANDYLIKPFSPKHLAACVEKWLAKAV